MKKVLLLGGLLAAATGAFAQNNVVKVNILSPLFKTGSFALEHKLSDDSSLQLGLLFSNASFDDIRFSGFAITPEYRFYLSEKQPAMEGFYVGPFLRYQRFRLRDATSDNQGTLRAFGGGVVAGRHWIFRERFSLDLFVGPSYHGGGTKLEVDDADSAEFEEAINDVPLLPPGFGIRTGLTFGVAF